MSKSLPEAPFTLKGGCFCDAIRYTISVPALKDRPIVPAPPEHSLGTQNESTSRLPQISLDHCNSCRRVAGIVLQIWMIIPQSWIQFSLQPKSPTNSNTQFIEPPALEVITGAVENTFLTKFSSSEGVNRTFCGRCGTHLSFHYAQRTGMAKDAGDRGLEWEPHMDITVGSLDKDCVEIEGFRPSVMDFPEDGIEWVKEWLTGGDGFYLKSE